jgi:hypothetical protein
MEDVKEWKEIEDKSCLPARAWTIFSFFYFLDFLHFIYCERLVS